MNLKNLFSPKSIAVIGVSQEAKKLGSLVFSNLKKAGFSGSLYGVNLNGGKFENTVLKKNIADIDEAVELAIIIIPREGVLDVVTDCGKKGVKNIIIISSGFSETGSAGKDLEQKIVNEAQKYGMRILGPNCLGLLSTADKLNATFACSLPYQGNLSLFSQSGAVGSAILDSAGEENLNFSKFVSLGNKADISENEILEFLENDPQTRVILGYLESVKDGREFLKIASRTGKRKPIILIKSGVTKASAKSVSSHTGNIAGSDLPVEIGFRQAGIIRVSSIDTLIDFAKMFLFSPKMHGSGLGIITNAGGLGVMAVDALESTDLKLAELSARSSKLLKNSLPPRASVNNPIDISGDATSLRYKEALQVIVKEKSVSAILVMVTPQLMTDCLEIAKVISQLKKSRKPIVVVFSGAQEIKEAVKHLKKNEIPVYSSPEKALHSLNALFKFSFQSPQIFSAVSKMKIVKPRPLTASLIAKAKAFGKDKITDGEIGSLKILEDYGIEVVKQRRGSTLEELARGAKVIGYPIALKPNIDILHKTEVGGVILNIKNDLELESAYHEINRRLTKLHYPRSELNVSKMETGLEIFLGAKKNDSFSPTIIFGIGGIYVEAFKDFSYRLAPVDMTEARRMIMEIKASKILQGFRTGKKYNLELLAKQIVNLSNLMLTVPEIKEIDINPIILSESKAVTVDAKIILE